MKKYTVKVDRPKISSEEIARRKDFTQLLQQYNRYKRKKPYFKTTAFLITVATIVSVLLIAIALYYSQLVRLKHASPAKAAIETAIPASLATSALAQTTTQTAK